MQFEKEQAASRAPRRIPACPAAVAATLVLLLLLAVGAQAAENSSRPRHPDYSEFRIVTERNIFNAGRSGRASRGSRETPRQVRVDSFALRGIMSYEKGRYAFFDGSSSQYRKAVRTADTLGGWKVIEIAANTVKIEANGTHHELRVGSQLRREDEGEWHVQAASEPTAGTWASSGSGASGASGGSSPGDSGAGSASTSGSDGGSDEVLKRLLQQREKEMQ